MISEAFTVGAVSQTEEPDCVLRHILDVWKFTSIAWLYFALHVQKEIVVAYWQQ